MCPIAGYATLIPSKIQHNPGEAVWYDDEREDSDPFKQPFETTVTVLPPEDPVINLHATQTQGVKVGDWVYLTLTAQNHLGRPPMRLVLVLPAPAGWSIKQLEGAESCPPNQCSVRYTVDPEKVRHISIAMVPNQSGKSTVAANIQWYFENDPSNVRNELKTLEISVAPAPDPTPSPIPTPPPPGTPPSPPPGPTAEQPPTPANTPPPAPASPLPPTTAPSTTAAAPTAAPPANTGGGCNPESAGSPLNGGGDLTLLGLTILGLMGWGGYRRRPKSGPSRLTMPEPRL